MDDEQPCRGLRKDGSPCRATPLPGRRFCWAHDDDLERVHKPPSSQVSFSTQRGPHRWLRGSPEDAPATLVRLLTLRNGAGAGAERRVTAGGRRIVCGWHQRILGSIKT